MPARGGESRAHRELKRASLLWAQMNGFRVAAPEVRVPHSRFRADVAACQLAPQNSTAVGQTVIFECKQSRPDFLKDRHLLQENLERFRVLNERRARLEQQLGVHHPSLRTGDDLFPHYESVDLSTLQHEGYQKLRRELDQVQRRIYGRTKFDRMVRWNSADLLYVVAPVGILKADELPPSWGLLAPERWPIEDEVPPTLELVRRPQTLHPSPEARLQLLQRIALKATWLTNNAEGLITHLWPDAGTEEPTPEPVD